MIERAEGTDLIDSDGRRYIDGVSSLWCNVHGHRHPGIDRALRDQLGRVAHSTMLGLTHPGAAELAARLVEIARRRPAPGLLLRLRLDRGRGGAEDGLPVLAAARRPARSTDLVRAPARRLPRRHARLGFGRRDRPLPFHLPAASLRLSRNGARRRRRPGADPLNPRGGDRRGRRRAPDPGRGGDARPPSRLPARRARALRPPRCASDLRRGRDRVRAHRHHVRLRAGAGRARLPLPRQGPHRRLSAAGCDPDHGAGLRGLPGRAGGVPHLLSRPHLHRQPARLRGGARQPARLRERADTAAPAAEDAAAARAAQ